jgi:hypothetical protein
MARFTFYAEEAELYDELMSLHGQGTRNIEKVKASRKPGRPPKVRKEGHRESHRKETKACY